MIRQRNGRPEDLGHDEFDQIRATVPAERIDPSQCSTSCGVSAQSEVEPGILAQMPHDDVFERFAASLSLSLASGSVANLRSLGEVVSVLAKDTAKFQATTERLIVFVATGAVKLVAPIGPDREQIVAFALTEEVLVLSPASHTPFELHALTDCSIIAFSADRLFQALAKNTEAAGALFAQTLSALDRSRERSVLLGRKTAQERTTSFLLDMAGRVGTPKGNTVVLRLPMSRREIADSIGLTIETVSRQLTELRESGVIRTLGRSEIVLLDLKRLRKLDSRAG